MTDYTPLIPTLPERFRSKFTIKDLPKPDGVEGSCWIWKTLNEYGQYKTPDGKHVVTHRVAYELLVGTIPKGLVLHHKCQNTRCCNPDHMKPITQRENVLLGRGPALARERYRMKDFCNNGHPLTPENLYAHPTRVLCRQCKRDRKNALLRKKAESEGRTIRERKGSP